MNETSSITNLKGIGEKTKDLFAKMGVYTVGGSSGSFLRSAKLKNI